MTKPWVPNKPEARLSIAVDRFLRCTLIWPFYCTAIKDDDDASSCPICKSTVRRSVQERVRDKNRGIKNGILDWDVAQGHPYLHRKLELKRGRNTTTEAQDRTIAALTACGGAPIVAWSLREVYDKLAAAGFQFTGNVLTKLAYWEAMLASWDRQAEAIIAGEVVRKPAVRKVQPRYLWPAS